jgi:hypothetical protein
MLDIGGDVGALVVVVDSRLLGHEVEARPVHGSGRAAHADVLARRVPGGMLHAVVIPGLAAGRYAIWLDAVDPWGEVDVHAGQITEVDRRASEIATRVPSGS